VSAARKVRQLELPGLPPGEPDKGTILAVQELCHVTRVSAQDHTSNHEVTVVYPLAGSGSLVVTCTYHEECERERNWREYCEWSNQGAP